MEYGQGSGSTVAATASAVASHVHRRHPRHKVQTLAYVTVDHANGGIIRDVHEEGLGLQAVVPLRINQPVHLRFELFNPRVRVETTGRVCWADSSGQAGIEFAPLPERLRRLLKDWMFTQLMLRAQDAFGADTIFADTAPVTDAPELKFSTLGRPAIRLSTPAAAPLGQFEWQTQPAPEPWFSSVSPVQLSWLVDGLVLLSAVLLFCLVGVAMTHTVPRWPVALAVLLGAGSAFTAVYWYLFVEWAGKTPGSYLADLAFRDSEETVSREEEPRFR